MEGKDKSNARARRAERLTGQPDGKYEMMQTKVRPVVYAKIKRIAKLRGISDYALTQMMFDAIVRFMDDRHNLTPEMEQLMSIFEHMEGWEEALNHADPSVNRIVGEAIYFLFDGDGKKKGCRAVHVTKPFFGNWSEDMNIQHILERCICLLMPEMYRRLRSLAVDMQCHSLYELFIKLIDHHAKDSDLAAFREMFADDDRSDWGIKPADQRYRTRHHHDVDSMPGLFDDHDTFLDHEHEDNGGDEDIDFENQIIKP